MMRRDLLPQKLGIFFFSLLLLGFSAQGFAQAVANDDVYNTDLGNPSLILNDIECGVGHILTPHPFTNDTAANPDEAQFYNSLSPQVGVVFPRDPEGDGTLIPVYFPFCSSANDGTFSAPLVFDYTLFDNADQTNATGQITINPPAQLPPPSITNDTYDADNLTQVPNPQIPGEFGYVLGPQTPFDNDTITPPADELGTIQASGNFMVSSGTGFVQITRTQSNQFVYFPGSTFTQTAIIDYFLADAMGVPINPQVRGTITINPPTPPSTTDDNIDGSQLQQTAGPGTGETTYTLTVNPLDNDTLVAPYDETQTFQATDNFALTSGTGVFQAFIGQSGPVFQYITSAQFTSPVTVTYNLRDAQGAVIPNTDATITINPPPVVDAVDDTITANDNDTVVDPTTNNIGYRVDPFANDIFAGQDPANLDLTQTLGSFTAAQGTTGSIQANNNNGIEVIYYPEGPFTQAAVFNYTLFDIDGGSDTATLTVNPPGTLPQAPPLTRQSDLTDACEVELANQRVPAVCQSEALSETLLSLSTISAQADAMFGMQGDLINNIRQRMSENRSVYNPASVAGLNSNLFGKQVPIGRIVQELIKPLTGGGAADDFLNSGRLGFFLNGNFTAGDRDETGLTGGYEQDGYNFTSGIDYRVNLNFIVGAALGIANEETEFSANRGEQSADVTSFSFYGNYFPSNALYADFLLMLTQSSLDVDRNVSFGIFDEVARADTDGDSWSFAGTLGYHWNRGAWEWDGYGRVEYTDLQIDGYTETGSSFDLTVADQETESLEAALGLKVARVFSTETGVVIPSLDLEWLSQFEDDARFIGVNMEQLSSGFAVQDESADSSYFNAALSLSSVFANGFSAYLRVESQFSDDHIGRTTYGGGLRWEF